jgi:L-rhamnose-H+ transport protein
MMWGCGTLTFGMTMRYLGMSLGMAVALGYCTVFGTIMPPIFRGEFGSKVLGTTSGVVILLGVGVCILGIVSAALAGLSKEREMSEDAKKAAIKEFNFIKGLLVATFSGIMSAGMSYGLAAAAPIGEISLAHGTDKIWTELPRLCVILAGGFVSNLIWCGFLFWKNGTGNQFYVPRIENSSDTAPTGRYTPMSGNYILCAIAGTTWYFQFFFYSMGETKMGVYQFASWPLHMASIMIFSSLWGIVLLEWKGSSAYTKAVLGLTLTTLIFSTIEKGFGTQIGKIAKENEMRELASQVNLLVSTIDGDSVPEICVTQTQATLALAKEVGLADTKPEQFEKVRQILEAIDPNNIEQETLFRLDEELQRLVGNKI